MDTTGQMLMASKPMQSVALSHTAKLGQGSSK